MENTQDFYTNLEIKLNETTKFPTDYLYKFIVKDQDKIAQIQQLFDRYNPVFNYKNSKTGKYTSVSIKIFALDSNQVIHLYKEVAKLEGVIML